MRTGYNIREGSQMLAERLAAKRIEVRIVRRDYPGDKPVDLRAAYGEKKKAA